MELLLGVMLLRLILFNYSVAGVPNDDSRKSGNKMLAASHACMPILSGHQLVYGACVLSSARVCYCAAATLCGGATGATSGFSHESSM